MPSWLKNAFLSWKTSGIALIGAIALLLSTFHVYTLTGQQQAAIVAVVTFLIGLFSKDGDVSGTVEDYNPVEGTVELEKQAEEKGE